MGQLSYNGCIPALAEILQVQVEPLGQTAELSPLIVASRLPYILCLTIQCQWSVSPTTFRNSKDFCIYFCIPSRRVDLSLQCRPSSTPGNLHVTFESSCYFYSFWGLFGTGVSMVL
jgi:hypothetical protein